MTGEEQRLLAAVERVRDAYSGRLRELVEAVQAVLPECDPAVSERLRAALTRVRRPLEQE